MEHEHDLSDDDIFYGQNGEDYILWEFFDQNPNGYFLDVGAFDGIYLSNSYFFEKKGWQGICLEPHPDYFPICKKNRPKSICLNFACVGNTKSETVEFFTESLGLFSGVYSDEQEEFISRAYRSVDKEYQGAIRKNLPATTLNKVLTEHLPEKTSIDFVSIDTEGNELDVLQGFDLGRFKPRVLIIETNNNEQRHKLTEYMVQHGYTEARIRFHNTFYVYQQSDIEKLLNIPVKYKQASSYHPLGESYTFKANRLEAPYDESQKLLEYKKLNHQLRAELNQLRAELNQLRAELKLRQDYSHELEALNQRMAKPHQVLRHLAALLLSPLRRNPKD